MTRTLGIGVVGCGDVSTAVYLPGIKTLEDRKELRLVGLCDQDESRLAAAATRYPGARAYTELARMLEDPDVDIVVNLTPMQAHAACSLQAITADKHVYSEKPIATTMDDANRVIQAARERGVKLACAPVLILHPEVRQACAWVRNGALGKISMVRARGSHGGPAWLYDYTTDPTWFYKPGGGPLFDLGVYPIHVLCVMLGPVKRVSAFAGISHPERIVRSGPAKGQRIEIEIPDNIQMMLDFGDSTFASLDATFTVLSAKGPRMEVYGEKGTLNLYSRPDEPPYELYVDNPETGVRGWLNHEASYRGSLMPYLGGQPARNWSFSEGIRHLVESVTNDTEPLIGGDLARHMLEVMEAAVQSAQQGRVVELSTGFRTPGEEI